MGVRMRKFSRQTTDLPDLRSALGEKPENGLERIRVIRMGEYIFGDCCGSFLVNCRNGTNFWPLFLIVKCRYFDKKIVGV
jgi:hypothetical protein